MSLNEERRPTPPQQHGHGHQAPTAPPGPNPSTNLQNPPKPKPPGAPSLDYKLLVDPLLVKGVPTKLYRIAGNVPDQPTYPAVQVKDPRKVHAFDRFWKAEPVELTLPRFKIDSNYVGTPPPLQVTITNINDNIDKAFLSDLLLKYGAFEEIEIFFHPVTKKHLGIAHILFLTTRGAAFCIEKLNKTSVMGLVLNVFLDPFKKQCKELLEDLTTEKKKEPPPPKAEEKPEPATTTAVEGKTHGHHSNKHKHGHGKEGHSHKSGDEEVKGQGHDRHHSRHSHGHAHSHHGLQKSTSFDSFPPTAPVTAFPPSTSAAMIQNAKAYYQPDPHAIKDSPPAPAPVTASVPSPYNHSNSNGTVDATDSIPLPPATDNGASPGQGMDLDTRIKMMLSGGAQFGALLGACDDDEGTDSPAASARRSRLSLDKNDIWKPGSDGEDDDQVEKSHARKFKRNTFVPVDVELDEDLRPPSPFLATAAYEISVKQKRRLQNGSALMKLDGLDEVSDESNEDEFSPSAAALRKKKAVNAEIDSSETSSSPAQMTPEMQAYFAKHGYPPPPPSTDGQTPYDPFAPPPEYPPWNGVDPSNYAAYYQQYPVAPPLPDEEDPSEAPLPDLPDLTRDEVLAEVEHRIFSELKDIVRRDCQKKLIEQCAFQVLEKWVADKDRLFKESQANDRLQKLQSGGLPGDAQNSDVFGLGFRATIPRMPSFRRQRSSSPRRRRSSDSEGEHEDRDQWDDQDEDSRDSFGERRSREQIRRRRSGSLSSSVSSVSSSSEDEDDKSSVSSKSSSGLDEKLVKRRDRSESEASSDDDKDKASISTVSSSEGEDEPSSKKAKLKEAETSAAAPTPPRKSKTKRLPSATPSPERRPHDAEEIADVDVETPDVKEELKPEKLKTFELALADIALLDHPYACNSEPPPEPEPMPPSKSKSKVARKPAAPIEMKPEPVFFKPRAEEEMTKIVIDFLVEGVDAEDYQYLKRSYELATSPESDRPIDPTLSKVRWIEHPVTRVDHKFKVDSWNRVNKTGSSRTEGFYRYTPEEKMQQKQHLIAKLGYEMRNKPASTISHSLHLQAGSKNTMIREARSHQRRLLTEFGDNDSDLLRFNQLKFRKKDLRFARSYIHDWGLFAAEPIAADEMVIEYVGQVVRAPVSDSREKAYEKVGIMSSYLFRLDGDEGLVVDATKCGNLSRFINHSCQPNCIAKTIIVDGEKKIVIYSKQEIAVDEEITYDYKFPLEDTKIKCLCGALMCRGYLN